MALDIDTDAMRRASEFVSNAGDFLHPDLTTDVPPCGSDEVSQAVMNNLNARRRWLVAHVKAGAVQASTAAAGITDTANSYAATDAAGAQEYGFGTGGGSPAVPASTQSAPMGGAPAPAGMPTFSPIPDISGTDGESVATQLVAGPGAAPATAAATQLTTLAGQAHAANASLTEAQGHILASGQSEAHPGITRRLTQAISWTAGVAGHADALAAGYGAAGDLHTSTATAVGTPAEWQTLKTAYADAVMENQLTGGLSQPKVDALQAALTDKETQKSTAMSGYQTGGQTVSTPPGDLPDPGLAPGGPSSPDKAGKHDKAAKDPLAGEDGQGGGLQDMLGPLMGALGPLTESLGKANPLQSLGQAAQQLGQQVSKLGGDAAKKAASPIKPAALAKPAGLGKGGGAGGKGGGGSSPIKPSNPLGGVKASSLSGSPSASPATGEPIKPAAAAAGRAGAGAGSGMGMMPMGHKPGGDEKADRIRSYEDPLSEVEEAGRPGIDGQVEARPAPVVSPEAKNTLRDRIAKRKQAEAVDSQS